MYATVIKRCFETDGIGLVSKDPETRVWQAMDMNDRSVLFVLAVAAPSLQNWRPYRMRSRLMMRLSGAM